MQTELYAKRWWALGALCLSLVVIGMDNTILNVALPTLSRDLGASASQLQWMVDSYVLVFAGLLLTMGALGDRFGRKKALNIGLTIFGLGSIASAFSGSASTLIATRALMGAGGALIMPSTLSIITNIFPTHERGRAIGIWAGVSGIGIILGPVAGGWLLEHFWWGSVFLVNVPIIAFAMIYGWRWSPTRATPRRPAWIRWARPCPSADSSRSSTGSSRRPRTGGARARPSSRSGSRRCCWSPSSCGSCAPNIPCCRCSSSRTPASARRASSITLVFFALFGTVFLNAQYLQFVLGYTPLEAGCA